MFYIGNNRKHPIIFNQGNGVHYNPCLFIKDNVLIYPSFNTQTYPLSTNRTFSKDFVGFGWNVHTMGAFSTTGCFASIKLNANDMLHPMKQFNGCNGYGYYDAGNGYMYFYIVPSNFIRTSRRYLTHATTWDWYTQIGTNNGNLTVVNSSSNIGNLSSSTTDTLELRFGNSGYGNGDYDQVKVTYHAYMDFSISDGVHTMEDLYDNQEIYCRAALYTPFYTVSNYLTGLTYPKYNFSSDWRYLPGYTQKQFYTEFDDVGLLHKMEEDFTMYDQSYVDFYYNGNGSLKNRSLVFIPTIRIGLNLSKFSYHDAVISLNYTDQILFKAAANGGRLD